MVALLLLPVGVASSVVSGESAGAGWVRYSLRHAGFSAVSLIMDGPIGGGRANIALFDEAGFLRSGIGLTVLEGGAHASVDVAERDSTTLAMALPTNGGHELILEFGGPPASFDLLLSVVGEVGGMTWRVDPGMGSLVPLDGGNRTFFSQRGDFESDVHVLSDAAGVSAALQRGGRMQIAIQDHFLGRVGFGGSGVGEQRIVLETASESRACPCAVGSFQGPWAVGPGNWIISREATRVEEGFRTVVLAGVDVPWPPPRGSP